MKHQSFIYSQSYDQTVLFQTIQFSIRFFHSQFKFQTVLFDPETGHFHVFNVNFTCIEKNNSDGNKTIVWGKWSSCVFDQTGTK